MNFHEGMGVALMVRVGDHPIAANVLKRWFPIES